MEPGSIDWYGDHIRQSSGISGSPFTVPNMLGTDGNRYTVTFYPTSYDPHQSDRGFSSYSGFRGSFGGVNTGGEGKISDLFAGMGDRVARDVLGAGGFLEENASRMTGIGDGKIFSSLEELLGQIEVAEGVNPDSPEFQFGQQGGDWVELGASLPFGGPEVKAAEEIAPLAGDAEKWIWSQSKSVPKSIRQMNQRGWTPQQVTEAIQGGKRFPAINSVNPNNPATRYVHPVSGQSVVQDTVTNEIIHFGGPGFLY